MQSKLQSQNEYVMNCLVCKKKQILYFNYQEYSYFKCNSCGLVTTYPYPDAHTIEAHYERKYDNGNYSLIRTYAGEYRHVYNKFADIIESELAISQKNIKGIKVLDIGCFTGEFLDIMNNRGADVYGVELQERAVVIANSKLPGRIYKSDVMSNDYPVMNFDVISLFGLIEHVLEPITILERSSELLQRDGLIVIQTPDSSSFIAKIMSKYWPPYAPIEHIHLFSKQSLELLLKKLGFKNISIRPHYKRLPIEYVYKMLHNFGPELFFLVKPLFSILPHSLTRRNLTFYAGEIVITAQKI